MNKYFTILTSVFLFLNVLFIFPDAGFAQKLIIDVKIQNEMLLIRAEMDGATPYMFEIPEAVGVIQKMELIYTMFEYSQSSSLWLEHRRRQILNQLEKSSKKNTDDSLQAAENIHDLLKKLGQQVFNPIQSMVDNASQIEFVITKECSRFPFDALYFNGVQLFLQKPVLYHLNKVHNSKIDVTSAWKGFMVSERTADPDRGVLLVKKLFPGSTYFDSSQVYLTDFAKAGQKDFVLISTHGSVKGLFLDHLAVYPKHLSPMKPRLVYLDSCTLGISHDFLNTLQKAGTIYYLGPILSNEDGNSSTITMNEFFKGLLKGEAPSRALFSARKILYNHFKTQNNDFNMLMYRAFTFRVYRLN